MNKAILINFYARWCGACKMQLPIIEELEKKFKNKVEFFKIDIDENKDLLKQFEVNATPTTFIVKDDAVLKKYIGYTDMSRFESDINMILR